MTLRGARISALIETGSARPQVAVIASRKVGSAVQRNKARRRLQAAVVPLLRDMPVATKVVVVATTKTGHMDFQKLSAELLAGCEKLGMVGGVV